MIRTADVDLAGHLQATAGATLVRDSVPAYEVAETKAKIGGLLAALGAGPAAGGRRGSTSTSWCRRTRRC